MCTAEVKVETDPKLVFVVVAFRQEGNANAFPIGVFDNIENANQIAKLHKQYKGEGKYAHRIYPFELNKGDGDVGTIFNVLPFI